MRSADGRQATPSPPPSPPTAPPLVDNSDSFDDNNEERVNNVIDMATSVGFMADAEQEAEEDRVAFAAKQEAAASEDSDEDID
jgi:hypothetical protein